MSDDNQVLSRRRVLSLFGSEFAKMAGLSAIGGTIGAVISYTQLDGMATVSARETIRAASKETGIEFDERALIDEAKKPFENHVKKGVLMGTILGTTLGNLLYEPVCKPPEPREPDFY